MKTFKGDFDLFVKNIHHYVNFSLSRWGDGELSILENKPIDLLWKGDGEFKYDPQDDKYKNVRSVLMKSYTYPDVDYYIGIACQCCVGYEKFDYMRRLSRKEDSNLTWANIFVNSNYKYFLTEFIPALQDRKIILIANKNSKLENLPFKIEKFYPVGADAWINNYTLSEELQNDIITHDRQNYVYLIAAGPFANILTYELWKCKPYANTIIDIGSTLDRHLGLIITRGYLQGAPTLNKTCIW